MGLTSIFYYKSVQYIPLSVGIVLLIQTVWMGVILEMLLHKKAPGSGKIVSVFIIMGGTILASNFLAESVDMRLGAIIASIEIPVSVLMAHIFLKDPVSFLQCAGIFLILLAVVVMNIKIKEKDLVIN